MKEKRIPSWLWGVILGATTDNLGEKGTHTILRRAGLEKHIGVIPENDGAPSISTHELSAYQQALFDIFGEEGAKPVLLRAGKVGFRFAQDNLPPVMKAASKVLILLPEKKRLEKVLTGFIDVWNDIMGTQGSVLEEDGNMVIEFCDSPLCGVLSTQNPAGFVVTGILTELVGANVGPDYQIMETMCLAKGDPMCKYRIKRM